jgi:hypothetical protein
VSTSTVVVAFRDVHGIPTYDPIIREYENMEQMREAYPHLRKSGPVYGLVLSDLTDPKVRRLIPNPTSLTKRLRRFGVKVPNFKPSSSTGRPSARVA